ncbi:hypothetical protein C8A03DRAFT_39033 [Achaetomium macrosporum]|uniref:Uncharacterized protein n=1 Tax=Achaetomium macrosporum TaxID=79813 RepID=A0AAN7H6N7_9PEZI|nr:hypothetical protein C8A03DRAFT_39033 [Achaetomium macrosporum]
MILLLPLLLPLPTARAAFTPRQTTATTQIVQLSSIKNLAVRANSQILAAKNVATLYTNFYTP